LAQAYDPAVRLPAAGLVLSTVAACGDGGGVQLRLELPEDPALDPLAQVAELRLTARAGGEVIHTATVTAPRRGAPMDFGDVPIADGVAFELAGVAPTGRVVAYGRSAAPIDVTLDQVIEVPVRVRRPFVYLSGGGALVAIDATLEPGDAYTTTIDVGGPVSGAAVTSDGADVVVATDAALRLVATATHQPGGVEVALPGPAVDLAISADGAWVATSHVAPAPGVAIVDLAALRAGEPTEATFVPGTRPGAVAIGGGQVWVLEEPIDDLFCTGISSVVAIPLDDPGSPSAPVALPRASGDLTVDPASGAAFVSVGCSGSLVRIAAPGASPEEVLDLPGLSALTVAGDALWAAGHVDGEDAHLTVAHVPLAGGDAEILDLPNTEERALAVQLEELGQSGLIGLSADLHSAYAIGVLPDGEHVAILDAAVYLGEEAGDAGGGQPVIPAMQMVTYEYQLVQLDTGLGAQRLRASCTITWEPGALLDDFRCARAPGQDEAPVSFQPGELTAIFGSR
jgi:hypothetical protein